MADLGHNSTIAADHLRSFIERIERLESEKRALAEDIKDIYVEAKGNGFDPKIIKKIVAIRRMDADKRYLEKALLETYLAALGDFVSTDLGRAAVSRFQRGGE